MVDVAHNLAVLRERIGHAAVRSGRPPDAIRLTLVTKTVGADRVREAILAGQHELGENKVQERSEEHTSELQSLMRISYAVFCLKEKTEQKRETKQQTIKNPLNKKKKCNNNHYTPDTNIQQYTII